MSTKIQWTDETWNPVTGCSKVSPGCLNCYAERMARRLAGRAGYPAYSPFRVRLRSTRLDEPLRWKKPRRVFVCSMGDIFHQDVPVDFIYEVLQRVYEAHWHVFQILTKRPERMREIMSRGRYLVDGTKPMKNLWLGVTAEDQQRADERIPLLLETPAVVRFVSVEPMLEKVDLWQYLGGGRNPIGPTYNFKGLDWVIVGPETGPGRRQLELEAERNLVNQCEKAGVPVFVKAVSVNGKVSHNPAEWPEDLRVREYPE